MRQSPQAKTRENRVRRMAARQGLVLHRSRDRDPMSLSYGRYLLLDPGANWDAVFGVARREPAATLAEIEMWLRSPRAARARQDPPAPEIPVMVRADDARSDARRHARVTK